MQGKASMKALRVSCDSRTNKLYVLISGKKRFIRLPRYIILPKWITRGK